jgi:metallo-beta-lactamase class B
MTSRRLFFVAMLSIALLSTIGLFAQYAPANPEWSRPVEPFRIIGNIYYVGTSDVSSFLITAPQGHILLDTGYLDSVPLVEAGVERLGFRVEDIKVILASHAHADHAGGVAHFRGRSKARFIANPAEVELFSRGGKGDFAFGDSFAFPPVTAPDGLLADKGQVELGGVAITVHFTPGHTKGCVSYAMKVNEGDKSYEVVIPCSLTAPGYKLSDNRKYPRIMEDFEASIARLRSLKCDVFLGGHSWDFGLKQKSEALKNDPSRNPFVDPEGYRLWLDKSEHALREQLEKERASSRSVLLRHLGIAQLRVRLETGLRRE